MSQKYKCYHCNNDAVIRVYGIIRHDKFRCESCGAIYSFNDPHFRLLNKGECK